MVGLVGDGGVWAVPSDSGPDSDAADAGAGPGGGEPG